MSRYCSVIKAVGLSLLLGLVGPGAFAKQAESLPPVITQLMPAARHSSLDQTIMQLLSHYHYRQGKVDDALSVAIFDAYLEALDFNRSYFLASDITDLSKKYRLSLDDNLLTGNLQPAYEMFNIFQRRLAERTARIMEQLRQDVDFNIDESLDVERKKAPWPASQAELDELWRKRLKNELLSLKLAGKDLAAARETLQKRYEGQLRRTSQSTSEDVFQMYMNAVSQSFDPHTAYFSPRASENFNIQMRLSLEGIGTVLRMEEERINVVELVAGGPADLSKQLKPNDKIVGVGQGDKEPIVDVVGWRLDDVVQLIRGPRGSVVRLQIVPAESGAATAVKTVRLVRDTVKLEKQAAHSEVKTLPSGGRDVRIGVITVPTFYSDFAAAQRGESNYRSTTHDVHRLLTELQGQKTDGVVLDLRQNGGGSLQEAVELTGLFIKEGPVVQVRNSSGGVEVENDPDPKLVYDGPLAVLVDRFSASASEIFAGAIQDYGRGLVIGDPTFGKGTVQTLIDLNRFAKAKDPSGQLKLTIAKFYRVNGSSTQNRGITPDIAFPSVFGSDEVGESAQQHALPWDEIKPTRYQGSRYLTGLVPELAQRYQARVAHDPAFSELLKDIDAAKQARQKTTVSLLESQRKVEWDKSQAKMRERENQHRISQGLKPLRADEAIPEHKDNEKDGPDLLLEESARIVADLVNLLDQQGGSKALVMSGS